MALCILYAEHLVKRIRNDLLCAENLVTAAESLYLGEHAIECLYAESHGVGVVDDPGIRAVVLYVLGNLLIHGYGAHCSHYSSGAGCIADRLINAVLLGGVHIGFHLVKCARENRYDDKIRPGERLFCRLNSLVVPHGFCVFAVFIHISDYLVVLSRLKVDVIEIDISRYVVTACQVAHETPRPAARAAAYIGDFYVLNLTVSIIHDILPPSYQNLISGVLYI